jgi:DNA-binding transcriptional LysR family regulator
MVNFRTFDLNLLRVMNALLDTGSTVAAAQRLHMSQPAISAALGRLRHALNDPLFVRQGRSLTPTDFARHMQEPLSTLLHQAEALLNGPEGFNPTNAETSFRISGSDFFAELLMPQLAEHLSRVAPLVRVQLVNLVPDSYVDALDTFDIDLALIPKVDPPSWAEQEVVFTSQFSVIARKDNPRLLHAELAPGDTIPIDLFCDMGHVLFSPDGNLRAMGDAALARVGRERRVVMSMPVFSGVYNAVSASDLIVLMPRALAKKMAPRVGLELYQAPIPLPPIEMAMIWHRRISHSPAHRWLQEQLRQILAPLDDPIRLT